MANALFGSSMSRLSETLIERRLSVTALRFACTVLLRLSLSEAFLAYRSKYHKF